MTIESHPHDPSGLNKYIGEAISQFPSWSNQLNSSGVFSYEDSFGYGLKIYDTDRNGKPESVSIINDKVGFIDALDDNGDGIFDRAAQLITNDFNKDNKIETMKVDYLSRLKDGVFDHMNVFVKTESIFDPFITIKDTDHNGKFDDIFSDGFWFFDTHKTIFDGSLKNEFETNATPTNIYEAIQ